MTLDSDDGDIYATLQHHPAHVAFPVFFSHTFSLPSTMSCTILSTRSYSGHMSWQVPTGVIAWASEVGFSGSERNPFLIASFRSCSRSCLSCGHEGRPNVTRYIFVSVVVGCNTYRLIEIAHALLVGPTIFHGWVTPALARRIRYFARMTLKG